MRPNHALAVAALSLTAAVTLAGCGAWPGAGDVAATTAPAVSSATPETTALPTFDPATAVGRYAPGFPIDLLHAPDDATVLASSARAAAEGPLIEVTLNFATPSTAKQVVDELGKRLRKAGFDQSSTDSRSGLTAQTAFTRTTGRKDPLVESLIVGVLDDGERRLVTVSGSVVVKE